MGHDIRKLFETEEETENKLPVSHRDEFQNKLKAIKPKHKQRQGLRNIFKYAASVLLLVTLSYFSFNKLTKKPIIKESALELQLKEVEQQYLENIEKEWESFKALADDEKLVKRYEKELNELSADYQTISKQFESDNKDILIIESLVSNLQTRLQLLKDIQEHINLLNQENGHYETIQI